MWQIGLIAYRLICWYVLPCGKACWGGSVVWCHVAQTEWGGPVIACHVALWWGPPVSDLCQGGAHLLTWTNGRLPRGTRLLSWPNLALPRGTPSLFFSFISPLFSVPSLYPGLWLSPSCTRVILIKSQLLINPFNLFYLLWIYFNSSTYPKIMKFSPKIPKFMMITSVIFNSIFTPVSLN
jgi:hypothetical protein